MNSGIIEDIDGLKSLYIQTDITNIADIQSATNEISVNAYVAEKEKYIEALNAATPANITKARIYNNAPTPLRYLGWGIMIIFFILAMIYDDSGLFEESTVTWPYAGVWVGIGLQVLIYVLKRAWKKLTIEGSVIHPAIVAEQKNISTPEKNSIDSSYNKVSAAKVCLSCGTVNKENSAFCSNCGSKL